MTPRYLVTGGAGFIGRHLASALIDRGCDVVVLDDMSTGKGAPDAAEVVDGDVRSPATLRRITGRIDAVFHLAGQSSGEASHDDPLDDLDRNASGTLRMLRWARDKEVPQLLYASSMAVYGHPDVQPVTEDAPIAPVSFYGVSKAAGERYVLLHSATDFQTTVVRMFSVYGPGQDLENMRQGIVSIYLAQVLRCDPLLIRGSPDRVRDLVHVSDVVAAWLAAVESPGGTYNVGSGHGTSVRDLARMVVAACGHDPDEYPIRFGDPTPGDQMAMVADISRARTRLGWEPRVDVRSGIDAMAASFGGPGG